MSKNTIIAFPVNEEPEDMYAMNLEQLQAHYAAMQAQLQLLDAEEPADMTSEAYEEWADEHEELEDYLDEILDRMEILCK